MRVAIVHDFLTQRGGAERVVLHLARTLRDPIVVTSLFDPDGTYPELAALPVRAARRVSGPAAARFRLHVLSYPGMFRRADLHDVDVVLVSSSAFAHHVRHPRSAVYWHTPPRFLYDPSAYRRSRTAGIAATLAVRPLRPGDRAAARHHQLHAANSARTAVRLRRAYGVEASVLHPPLGTDRLLAAGPAEGPPRALVVSRLMPYKRIDVAIRACRILCLPLTVVGTGPDEGRLRRLAGHGVTFVPTMSEPELARAYVAHSVVLNPGQDDFGYVPLEAAYTGRPVVALRASGAAESVEPDVTGSLVEGWRLDGWTRAIESALARTWDPERLRAGAERFSSARFDEQLAAWLAPLADPADILRTSAGVLGTPAEAAPASRPA